MSYYVALLLFDIYKIYMFIQLTDMSHIIQWVLIQLGWRPALFRNNTTPARIKSILRWRYDWDLNNNTLPDKVYCRIYANDEQVQLSERGSISGVYVNGDIIKNTTTELSAGDYVGFGVGIDQVDTAINPHLRVYCLYRQVVEIKPLPANYPRFSGITYPDSQETTGKNLRSIRL